MWQTILPFYERELHYIRQLAREFAERYPGVAKSLLLNEGQSGDPHVERLIEAVAFQTARIQQKLEDDLPEVTDALLALLYPHYLLPIPPLSIVQFDVDAERATLTHGYQIERGTPLISPPVDGVTCQFRTCAPVTLWPIEVETVQLETAQRFASAPRSAAAVIRIVLRSIGTASFANLALDAVRFYLHGDPALVYPLYELLFNNVCAVHVCLLDGQTERTPVVLSPECLRPVGFAPDEALLPYSPRSFVGYRLLQEYFALPEKFLFCEIQDLGRALQDGGGERLEIRLYLDRLPRCEHPISKDTFRLGCTPIINLFDCEAQPIRLTHTKSEYQVVPDVSHAETTEIYAVNTVKSTKAHAQGGTQFAPFYSFKWERDSGAKPAFWQVARKPSRHGKEEAADVFLSVVDLNLDIHQQIDETLAVQLTCTNGDRTRQLSMGGGAGDLYLEEEAPVLRVRCLKRPTRTIRPTLGKNARWRLLSHLSLNYLSLCEGGKDAFQEILRLYDFSEAPAIQRQIAGITNVTSQQRTFVIPNWGACRGTEVTLEFDETQFVGSGAFLFASVLEHFIRHYASLNTLIRLRVTTHQRKEPFRPWSPTLGSQPVL